VHQGRNGWLIPVVLAAHAAAHQRTDSTSPTALAPPARTSPCRTIRGPPPRRVSTGRDHDPFTDFDEPTLQYLQQSEQSKRAPVVFAASEHRIERQRGEGLPTCGESYPSDFESALETLHHCKPLVEMNLKTVIGRCTSQHVPVVRCIGEGGMARVYEARHIRLSSKRFALKILHAELAKRPDIGCPFSARSRGCCND